MGNQILYMINLNPDESDGERWGGYCLFSSVENQNQNYTEFDGGERQAAVAGYEKVEWAHGDSWQKLIRVVFFYLF